jgi:hypothetical protein
MGELLGGFVLGVTSGLIANFFSPAFSRWARKVLSRVLFFADASRYDLSGVWRYTYQEPSPGVAHVPRTINERVKLKQLGIAVDGNGITDVDPREFAYTLTVDNHLVYGPYQKKALKGNIVGTGMIQLVVAADRKSMTGQVTWFDGDTSRIESAPVTWYRQ